MRDALSIMDQAIASAPVENGRAVLAAAQIRELMGSVPNAVFERLLEAVAAGQSAELMEQLNLLVNAGHSPSSLARQMVRYLRNTLMAKLGGEQTELLQISGDERARAARTALLFTEEELTRNLQIVLRTFDDLNYRQEQRFHLELGLLKLIHAQRLLPLEELLSGVVAGGASAPRTHAAPRLRFRAPRPRPRATSRAAPAAPSISPFGRPAAGVAAPGSQNERQPRSRICRNAAHRAAIATAEAATCSKCATPFPAATSQSARLRLHRNSHRRRAGQGSRSLAAPVSTAPSMEALRHAIGSALVDAGHNSAAQLLGAGAWTLDGSSLRIEVPGVGKKMLSPHRQCRGGENHPPGAATARRAHAFPGRSRRRQPPSKPAPAMAAPARRQHSGSRARQSVGPARAGDLQGRGPQRASICAKSNRGI